MAEGQAWLALSKSGEDYRRLVGGERYDDDPASRYSWDSSVPNHGDIAEGDIIALWDQNALIGISVIQSIDTEPGTKQIGRCPACNQASFEARKTMKPTYRCIKCEETFDIPVFTTREVTRYTSHHAESWVDLDGLVDAATLRQLCVRPGSQNSFRRLKIDALRQAIAAKCHGDVLKILDTAAGQIAGGHKKQLVRVRIGQGPFRAKLLERYGEACAVSGPAPAAVLDACHLYKYADVGEHRDEGGLLMRKDLHRLFDEGLLAVDGDGALDVAAAVREYPAYGQFHGRHFR